MLLVLCFPHIFSSTLPCELVNLHVKVCHLNFGLECVNKDPYLQIICSLSFQIIVDFFILLGKITRKLLYLTLPHPHPLLK